MLTGRNVLRVSLFVLCLASGTFAAHAQDGNVHLRNGDSVTVAVNVEEAGDYNLALRYLPSAFVFNPEFSVMVNGRFQNRESTRIIAPINWQYGSFEFTRNRRGNEQLPRPEPTGEWERILLRDSAFLLPDPLTFRLERGENSITMTGIAGELEIGELVPVHPRVLPDYDEFRHKNVDISPTGNGIITIQAQHPSRLNSSSIRLVSSVTPDARPYDSRYMLLNTLGGDSWSESGYGVTYRFYVGETGDYQISMNLLQNSNNMMIFRDILIDGEIPFRQLKSYPFPDNRRFTTHTLSDDSGSPFSFFFEQGYHEITLVADVSPNMPMLVTLGTVREEIRELSLAIRRLAGNRADANRDWRISEFIPDVEATFERWISGLEESLALMRSVHGGKTRSVAEVELNQIIRRLKRLMVRPDELPFRLSELSVGASSAAVLITGLEERLATSPITLNEIYIHEANETLPAPAGFFRRLQSAVMQFFASFGSGETTQENALEVWVTRSQQHLELMQYMADSIFTPKTGIAVNLSVMPVDTNIILANAGGRAPDAAMGLSVNLPYQMAIRGAAADLSRFPEFHRVVGRFAPGSLLPLMYEDGLFGFPETQDFYVTFYRTDLLTEFGIPVPNTWREVIGILPDLNRIGTNFYVPLSGPAAQKPFMFTAPFVYQAGGDFYSEDGLSTAINSEESVAALSFMTELFTLYNLPIQVANFYNDFRYGGIPIGISNAETYILLTAAAPEIAGLWNIALHPGTETESGEINRWATGSAQVTMILEQSRRKDDAFAFLDWWTSAETQTDFAQNLFLIYGRSFLWPTANLQAFANLPIPAAHRETILSQWEYLKEVPLTPASYIIEREVSNIWNTVVFDGARLRLSVDGSVNIINREMARRMESFGYMQNGRMVRPFPIPDLQRARELISRE